MRKQSTIAMLLLMPSPCMMVASTVPPIRKRKENGRSSATVDGVGDSVFPVDSLSNEIKPKLKQVDDTTQMDSLRESYMGNITK